MAENKTEVFVGGAVLALAFGFGVIMMQTVGADWGKNTYSLSASFRSVEGINAGTDVRLSGVSVGQVTSIALNTDTFRADTTFKISNGVSIPDDSAVTIASEGLLGGNFVEIVPGGSLDNYENGAEIEDTQGSVSLLSLLLKFVSGDSGS